MYIITLDTGTTNTRVTLWENNELIYKVYKEVGVRDTAIEGNNKKLKDSIKQSIEEVLDKNRLCLEDITKIIASGMLTSNVGIFEIKHLVAPVGIEDLAKNMVKKRFPEIVNKDIWFIPGIKNHSNQVTIENCEEMDVMRGEEVETFGLISKLQLKGPLLLILPGSHSKFVTIDQNKKIIGCMTSLAGEMISAITYNTILSDALGKSFATQLKPKFLLDGVKMAKKFGINRSLFTLRVLDQFSALSTQEKANMLLGIILSDDIKAIKNSNALDSTRDYQVVISGKGILRDSFKTILDSDKEFIEVNSLSDATSNDIAGYGALCVNSIYEEISSSRI
ncbi:2-dehydro-3-deoxygalactonokinase (plasmid) [Priestia megaterium]|uniref:2-dehydro-3-deoxygalactonokinase n=1 Tax=Priestia megaterium TaxID=1404 RepID=UPI003899EF52